jgi:hypothetical protein
MPTKHTATKCLEVGSQELEITMYFEYDKGERYARFGDLPEPETITINDATAQTIHNGKPRGKSARILLGDSTTKFLTDWLLEHPERWK